MLSGNNAFAFFLSAGFSVKSIENGRYVGNRSEAAMVFGLHDDVTSRSRSQNVLIAIRQPHAEAIFSGRKPFELRRRCPNLTPGTACWVYSPRPVGAIVGRFFSGAVTSFATDDRISRLRVGAGTAPGILATYLERVAIGWSIECVAAQGTPRLTILSHHSWRDCRWAEVCRASAFTSLPSRWLESLHVSGP